MKTDLNDSAISFFKRYNLKDITNENIIKHFKNINVQNDYGGILHACVHNKFDEEKVLKLMETLMELGIDVNLRGKLTGYTFIHLALYGYTEGDIDYSYSTDFIVKIISLAKKYNFNVNIVDNDKDTLIHTAIASEVYNGKIEPLIDELGIDFKIDAKDNNVNDIYQSLLYYKDEADRTYNKMWLTKLKNEEQMIKNRVEISKYNLDDLKNKIKDIENKLKETLNELDINMFLTRYENINNTISDLDKYIKIAENNFNEKITSDISYKVTIKIKKTINNYISYLEKNLNLNKITELENVIKKSPSLSEELEKLLNIKNNYLENVAQIRNKITNSFTLNELSNIEKEIYNLKDETIISELTNVFDEYKKTFTDEINSIKELNNLINITIDWLSKDEKIDDEIDLINFTLIELKNIKKEKSNYLKKIKSLVLKSLNDSVYQIINSTNVLVENHIFNSKDISNSIFKIVSDEEKSKTKKRGTK